MSADLCPICGASGVVTQGVCSVCGHGARSVEVHRRRKPKRPTTSQEAWRDVQGRITAIHNRILAEIQKAGNLTDDELEHVLKLSHQNVSARTNELRNARRIIDSGVRRRTRNGRLASAWTLADAPVGTKQETLL